MRAELNMFWTWNSIRNAWFMKNDLRIFQPLNSHSGWKWAWHIYFFVCVCACFFAIRAHFFLHTHCVTLQMWIWMHAGWLFCSVNLHIIVHTLSLSASRNTQEKEREEADCAKKSLWIAFFHICKWNQNNEVMLAQILQIQNLHKNTFSCNECWCSKHKLWRGLFIIKIRNH